MSSRQALHAQGWRIRSYDGLLISPAQQVRDGLEDGWHAANILKFMVATGIDAAIASQAIAEVQASGWVPDPRSRLIAAWLRTASLPPPRPRGRRDGITDFDRQTVARMFDFMGYPQRAERVLSGRWEWFELLPALAAYRERFEAGEELVVQSARLAAAEYLDATSIRAFGEPDDICAPSLRNGRDAGSPIARAFIYHHKRLCALDAVPLPPAPEREPPHHGEQDQRS